MSTQLGRGVTPAKPFLSAQAPEIGQTPPWQEEITKNIQPRSQQPSGLLDRRSEAAGVRIHPVAKCLNGRNNPGPELSPRDNGEIAGPGAKDAATGFPQQRAVMLEDDLTVRYYGLYANAHWGKVKKANLAAFPPRIIEDKLQRIPSKGWAEMIRKVYEVDPLVCPHCGGKMKVIVFLTDYAVVDRISNHLKLKFVADKPPPPHRDYLEVLMGAEASVEYFS